MHKDKNLTLIFHLSDTDSDHGPCQGLGSFRVLS